MTNARLLEHKFRDTKVPDSKYNEMLEQINQLTTKIWIPPCVKKDKAIDPTPAPLPNPCTKLDSVDTAEKIHLTTIACTRATIFTLDSAISLDGSFHEKCASEEIMASDPEPEAAVEDPEAGNHNV